MQLNFDKVIAPEISKKFKKEIITEKYHFKLNIILII